LNTILHYLFLVRFRKLVSKGDTIAIVLIMLLYFAVAFLIYKNYDSLRNYIFFLFLDVLIYHVQRTDIDLLRLKKNYKTILFIEYLIYSFPFYLILFFKNEFVFITGILLFTVLLINIPKLNLKIIPYPFDSFNIFWHVTFRKYKLIYSIPILVGLIYIGIKYNNDNLTFLAFFALSLISCIPSFERERFEEIKLNSFLSEKYLLYQFKNSIINTFYIAIPIIVAICAFFQWEKLLFVPIIFIPPLLNIVLKYIYFNNNYLHQIAFTFFIASSVLLYGIPLLATPFMYKKAIKKLNIIKYGNY
jgi:hypothetical protein